MKHTAFTGITQPPESLLIQYFWTKKTHPCSLHITADHKSYFEHWTFIMYSLIQILIMINKKIYTVITDKKDRHDRLAFVLKVTWSIFSVQVQNTPINQSSNIYKTTEVCSYVIDILWLLYMCSNEWKFVTIFNWFLITCIRSIS